jgi:hypothetical protein
VRLLYHSLHRFYTGEILRLVLPYAIQDIHRFARGQDFVSSCRLVNCATASAGKRYGTGGTTIGNAYLKWACSEAAVPFLRDNPSGQKDLTRLGKTYGTGKALAVLAHRLARAVYPMLTRAQRPLTRTSSSTVRRVLPLPRACG